MSETQKDQQPEEKVECPFPGCDQSSRYYEGDEHGKLMAEDDIQHHFAWEHRGTVRVLVAVEKEVSLHPKQDVEEIRENQFERFDEKLHEDIAWVRTGIIDQPDEWPEDGDGDE